MIKNLHALFHPDEFQGWGKTKKYFEGWYYKLVNADETKAFAFIPGVAMDDEGRQQAFVQVLDGKNGAAEYHKFDRAEFRAESGSFNVRIADNVFSSKSLELNLPTVRGKLQFENLTPWPSSWYSPGIMGPFTFVPFMECYHGILSMDHSIQGELIIHGEVVDFSGGRGYMEKDWGHSFPSAYFWLQTNHFSTLGISLKASVANIPWLGSSFVGCIAGVWLGDRLIQFTTYNGSKIKKSKVDEHTLELCFENPNYRLDILAYRAKATALASPISGFMDGRIEESMTSCVDVMLFDKRKKVVLLHDTGRNAALEVAGKVEEITM
jgi:hypothetical protein